MKYGVKVARSAGVGIETIRFYEREGLIAEPPRSESGYRQYAEGTIARIRFTKRAKQSRLKKLFFTAEYWMRKRTLDR